MVACLLFSKLSAEPRIRQDDQETVVGPNWDIAVACRVGDVTLSDSEGAYAGMAPSLRSG